MNHLIETLKCLFVPHPGNNHRAKLRDFSGLSGLIGIVLVIKLWTQIGAVVVPQVLGYSSEITPEIVLQLTNEKRLEKGLPALRFDGQLADAAARKANDMFDRDYWAHVTPTGEQPWNFITATGYTYLYAGENLARDFADPGAVVDAWMASASHRENLLNSNYDDIGIAVLTGDLNGVQTTLVVQMFGTRRVATEVVKTMVAQIEASPVEVDSQRLQLTVISVVSPTPTSAVRLLLDRGGENLILSTQPWLNPFNLNRAVSLSMILLLIVVLALDELLMLRKHLGRIAGRAWAHFIFLLVTLGMLWLGEFGVIL
jgi:hypothetical protein